MEVEDEEETAGEDREPGGEVEVREAVREKQAPLVDSTYNAGLSLLGEEHRRRLIEVSDRLREPTTGASVDQLLTGE